MEYIHVRNLEKYHPGYKDRNLQWCKTYFKMVSADPEFELLCEIDKWRFVAFVMLELQVKRPIPLDKTYLIRKGFDLKTRPISLTIQMLHNFLDTVTQEQELCSESVTQSRVDKEKEVDKIKRVFNPPNENEVLVYFTETLKATKDQALRFYQFYGSKGWTVGKNSMKDWHLAAAGSLRWAANSTLADKHEGIPESLKKYIK